MNKQDFSFMLHLFQGGHCFFHPMMEMFIKRMDTLSYKYICSQRYASKSNMYRSNVHLLDLPNEILLIILKKLDNIDVLYSLSGINNQRLDSLAQEKIFTNVLNLVSASMNNIYSIPPLIFHRFCYDILPRVHHNVKCLVLDSSSMERILLAADYPNLCELKLFNSNQDILSSYFTGKSFIYSTAQKAMKRND
jgi:hypothetical protein